MSPLDLEIYERIGEEVAAKEYHKGILAKAIADAGNDPAVLDSLYVKYRYAQLLARERQARQHQPLPGDTVHADKPPAKRRLALTGLAGLGAVLAGISMTSLFVAHSCHTASTSAKPEAASSIPVPSPAARSFTAADPVFYGMMEKHGVRHILGSEESANLLGRGGALPRGQFFGAAGPDGQDLVFEVGEDDGGKMLRRLQTTYNDRYALHFGREDQPVGVALGVTPASFSVPTFVIKERENDTYVFGTEGNAAHIERRIAPFKGRIYKGADPNGNDLVFEMDETRSMLPRLLSAYNRQVGTSLSVSDPGARIYGRGTAERPDMPPGFFMLLNRSGERYVLGTEAAATRVLETGRLSGGGLYAHAGIDGKNLIFEVGQGDDGALLDRLKQSYNSFAGVVHRLPEPGGVFFGNAKTEGGEAGKKTDRPSGDESGMKRFIEYISNQRLSTKNADWRTKLLPPPEIELNPAIQYSWSLQTTQGNLEIRLLPEHAPRHVVNLIYLSMAGFYRNEEFFQVVPGFLAKTGCPAGDVPLAECEGVTYTLPKEVTPELSHDRPGLLCMSGSGEESHGSSLFILLRRAPHLDGGNTIFGELLKGEGTLEDFDALAVGVSKPPREPIVITKSGIRTDWK